MEKIRVSVLPQVPSSVEDVAASISGSAFSQIGEKRFFQCEVSVGQDKAFILSHEDHLSMLKDHTMWYADGTFKIRQLQNIFAQVIHLNLTT